MEHNLEFCMLFISQLLSNFEWIAKIKCYIGSLERIWLDLLIHCLVLTVVVL